MKVTKAADVRPTCSGVWAYGPSIGQRCGTWRNLIKCNHALDPGCELYFCLVFHWHDHWDTHIEPEDKTP